MNLKEDANKYLWFPCNIENSHLRIKHNNALCEIGVA